MAKATILDWDPVAANNTDVGGIGIQGVNAVSNFDNALREIMAQVKSGVDYKAVYSEKSANYLAVLNDNNKIFRFTAAATLSLTAAATLGANWHIVVIADGGAVIVDPNAAELIDGAATITIPNGSSALITGDGAKFVTDGQWMDAQASVSVASAATTDIGAAASRNVTITGTTTITGLGTVKAGVFRYLTFSGALTLTHNATSLILPGGANILTAANDFALAYSLGSGNWRIVFYQRAASVPLSATGTAPTYACRAWVNFDGTAGPSVRGSANISSVVRNGTGDYSISFITAMPDAAYAIIANGGASTIDTTVSIGTAPTASACRVFNVSAGVAADNTVMNVGIFR